MDKELSGALQFSPETKIALLSSGNNRTSVSVKYNPVIDLLPGKHVLMNLNSKLYTCLSDGRQKKQGMKTPVSKNKGEIFFMSLQLQS